MQQARQLFRDFCYYRQHTAHVQQLKRERPYLRDLKETPARLKIFARMAKWCEDRQINPREWLYSLFVSRRWLFCPKMEAAHFQSEKHLPKFRKLQDFDLFKQRQADQAAHRIPESRFDSNRDISHAAEEAKAAYLRSGQVDQCMAVMAIETFGYHPRSKLCMRCPGAVECQRRLVQSVTFDVLALRRGEITSEQARAQALSRVQHYGK